jgi:hypothetical protein
MWNSQLQQGQIRITVVKLLLALSCNIILEDSSGFGIVAIQAIQNYIDMFWSLRTGVKGDTHVCGLEIWRVLWQERSVWLESSTGNRYLFGRRDIGCVKVKVGGVVVATEFLEVRQNVRVYFLSGELFAASGNTLTSP